MRLPDYAKILKSARPNRHYVALVKYEVSGSVDYSVIIETSLGEGEVDECELEIDTLEEAETVFAREVKDLSGVANWQAQADYDAAHGTCNGYADLPRREY